jgi:hypothetical protein
MQDFSGAQSESATQPIIFVVSIGLHVPLPLLMYPSGHIQRIVLTGIVARA